MKHREKLIGLILLLFAIGFNLWAYRLEPTASLDPNDNTFQFALVDRTNQMWDFANSHCSGITKPFCALTYLTDHWVPNWAQGYNLPYYYSHIPQITIVATWRLFQPLIGSIPLFTYYHWIIYLLLSLFPLSMFVALRLVGLSWLTAGFGAVIATHLSTDGLYGLDPSSFLWRGYGLSSQLFAMIWLPLAIAYTHRLFTALDSANWRKPQRDLLMAILFLAGTTAGHLGIGIMAFMTAAVVAFSPLLQSILHQQINKEMLQNIKNNSVKLVVLFGGVGLLLGYWILPILKDGNYHNISVWDPIWKFNSYGFRDVLKNLFNGDLFDFGRFPVLTALVGFGFFLAARGGFFPFSLLFLFWLLLYFGRTTWGGLIDLIPGMKDFHLSRFIVGVHIAGLFLISMAFESFLLWLSTISYPRSSRYFRHLVAFVIFVILVALVYPQTLRYSKHNDFLIDRANTDFAKISSDTDMLIAKLQSLQKTSPGRVYFGRGGNWGKNFKVAETPYYLYASTYGIPIILWLPQTWSPNSDTEQYFSDDRPQDYALYNVRYVVTPPDLPKNEIRTFWKPLAASKTWKLYEVVTEGYVTTGVRPAIVSIDKENFTNLIHLWIQSDFPTAKLYPELTFARDYPKNTGLPNFRMIDEVTYKVPDGSLHNLFAEIPSYQAEKESLEECSNMRITSEENLGDMIFKANVEKQGDAECLVILKQSFHPSWMAMIDGKAAETITLFPFYTGITLQEPGSHEVVFSYQPSSIKKLLLLCMLFTLIGLLKLTIPTKR